MQLDFVERYCEDDAPLQRLDARLKLFWTLLYVLIVVVTPVGWWATLAAEGLILVFLVGLSGVSPRELAIRWLGFLILFGFLTLMVAPTRPESREHGVTIVALTILLKDTLSFLATLLLVQVTPFRTLLVGMRRLGMPVVLVATLQFMYRYLFVLTEELDRMVKARRARTFRRSGRLHWGLLSGLIGMLFLRSFERGERVHAAMLARGWDGTIRTLD
ncbi:MAG: cobalt ECF transporter T component CbiQ [Isosphaeraceae bacterium]